MSRALTLFIALLLACIAATAAADPALDGDWVMTKLGDTSPLADTSPGITFDGDRFHGSTGCNGFSGTAKAEGGELSLANHGMTEMACPDARMKQESEISKRLTAATTYRVEGDRLTIGVDIASSGLAIGATDQLVQGGRVAKRVVRSARPLHGNAARFGGDLGRTQR